MTGDAELPLFGSVGSASEAPEGLGDLQTADGLLALMTLPGIGTGRAIKLANAFRTLHALNAASNEERRSIASVLVDTEVTLRPSSPPEGTRLVGYFDESYPNVLRRIKNPPAVLWVRGSLPDPDRRVAVVGSRKATSWGLQMAETVAHDAAAAGVSVVSGLALGIDIAAHRGALAGGGHTTAILGSGIDRPTPSEHRADAEAIVASGGCVLAEVPPGTPASPRTLVARNRLQAGLSAATVIIQCGTNSGTMTTAAFTVEQGKTLAVPQPPEDEASHSENQGSQGLLAAHHSAMSLQSRDDLVQLLAAII